MLIHDITSPQLDVWLKRLRTDWQPMSIDVNSLDGQILYKILRCGFAEATTQFVAWHPELNFEVWFEGTISGQWKKAELPAKIRQLFDRGRPPHVFAHQYTAFRLLSPFRLAIPDGKLKQEMLCGPFTMNGEAILALLPIDNEIRFSESFKRVERVVAFYSRVAFENYDNHQVPINSILRGIPLQGISPGREAVCWNVAEFEPKENPTTELMTSQSVAFEFAQACYAISDAVHRVVTQGSRGELSADSKDIEQELGNATARLHRSGNHVLRMYHRQGRDSSHIASLISEPLAIRNVDQGLLREVEAVAVTDAAIHITPETTRDTNIQSKLAGLEVWGRLGPDLEAEYLRIFELIRNMGRSFETTPETYNKFGEQELRNFILTHLNGHLSGDASGERFRKHGKTDICVMFPQGEAFVAECKIWEGPSECIQALDQLMSYVTTRDRIGALIFLNKTVQNFTNNVVNASLSALNKSLLFITQHATGHFGEHCVEVQHKDDRDRKYVVHVLLFNLYPNPRSSSELTKKQSRNPKSF